jgi:hypothetical protein
LKEETGRSPPSTVFETKAYEDPGQVEEDDGELLRRQGTKVYDLCGIIGRGALSSSARPSTPAGGDLRVEPRGRGELFRLLPRLSRRRPGTGRGREGTSRCRLLQAESLLRRQDLDGARRELAALDPLLDGLAWEVRFFFSAFIDDTSP